MWMIQPYEEVIQFQKNLVSNIFNMKGGIRSLMLDFLAQIIKHGVSVYWAPKSVSFKLDNYVNCPGAVMIIRSMIVPPGLFFSFKVHRSG